jgi:hypothetical protein
MSIHPARGSSTNTYETQVQGLREDYTAPPLKVEPRTINARFTSDAQGETLSLECGDVMYLVPFGPLKELIEYARTHHHGERL